MRWLIVLLLCGVAHAETLTLTAGWNPVGLRVQRVEAVTGGTALAVWDGTRYVVSEVTAAALNAGDGGRRGCWIFSASGGTLTYTGSSDGRGDFLQLAAGWNLVALPGVGEVPGSSLVGGQVLAHEVGTGLVNLSSGGRLRPGRAYWFYSAAAARLTWPTPPAPSLPVAWEEQSQVVVPDLVSSTTLPIEGGFRLYHFVPGEFVSRTSTDGLNYSAPVATGLRAAPGTTRDRIKEFSVIRLSSGGYLMVYEAVDRQNLSRFFRATSADGVTFSGAPEPILQAEGAENNFISAPDIVEVGGVVYLYYVADQSRTFLATSTDAGLTWTRRGAVSIRGFAGNLTDADVLTLPDGRFALFALHDGRGVGLTQAVIVAATSTDGMTFDFNSVVLTSTVPGSVKVNPDVVPLPDGRFWMYFAVEKSQPQSFTLYRVDSI